MNQHSERDEVIAKSHGPVESQEAAASYDVICLSIIDWNFRFQRPQQIMAQFAAEGHRVFYLKSSYFTPSQRPQYLAQELGSQIYEVTLSASSPIDIYSGLLSPAQIHDLAAALGQLCDDYKISDAVLVVQLSTWAPVAYQMRERFAWPIIYDCMDDWATFPGLDRQEHLLAEERRLVWEADLLVVSSQRLLEKWSAHNASTLLARNAADFEHFSNPTPNAEMAAWPRPLIGYIGAITEWFDLDLVRKLALSRPAYTYVLIGDVFDLSLEDLNALSNVRLLGLQPYQQLPGYLAHFDACLIPFKVNAVTEAMDVVKFYEYISQGKPVVASRLRELLIYEQYLYLAADDEEFLSSLDRAVLERDEAAREQRLALARANTWQERLDRIKRGIETLRSEKRKPTPLQDGSLSMSETKLYLGNGHEERRSEADAALRQQERLAREMRWLEERLTHFQRLVEERGEQLTLRERIITAKDENLARLANELQYQRELFQQLSNLSTGLSGRIDRNLRLTLDLDARLAGQAQLVEQIAESHGEALRLTVNEAAARAEAAFEQIRRQLLELTDLLHSDRIEDGRRFELGFKSLEERLDRLAARPELAEKTAELERALRYKIAQVDERDRIIKARDEAIAWLKGEVAEAQDISRRLTAVNQQLGEELEAREFNLRALRERIGQAELDLRGLKLSRGWRLLEFYRRIRARWRRLLGHRAPEQTTPPPAPPLSVPPENLARINQLLEETTTLLTARQADSIGSALPDSQDADQYPGNDLRLLPQPDLEQLISHLEAEMLETAQARVDIICFSIIDWDFRYQRPQQIMSQFAAHGHRVFYLSTTRFRAPEDGRRVRVVEIKKNVFEVHLGALRQVDVYGEVISGRELDELLASLSEMRREYGIEEAVSYVMIASWSQIARAAKERWGWGAIYDCMDEWENFPGIKPVLLEAERELVEDCDLLLVSSQRLYDKWHDQAGKMVLVRNAVDSAFYAANLRPNNLLADVPHPIVGYYGAIAAWFDVELVAYLAAKRPEYQFVLLGGVFQVDIESLSLLPNVHLLGQRPYELMPKYLYHFDACIIPFLVNPITEATDPVKLYEYLSSGKPVVATALPELEVYREHIYLAGDREEFLSQLDRAIEEDGGEHRAKRQEVAHANTWEDRYRRIFAGIRKQTPKASIIIVTYGNLALNKLCLESVLKNTAHPNYEVIVVDNASEDRTPNYLRYLSDRHAQVKVLFNRENEGFARANNQGIAASDGDYIVLLNNDTVVPPGWLSRLLRHLRHDEVGLVGPVTNFVGNEARIEVSYETLMEMERFARTRSQEWDGKGAEIHMLAMFCVAMRRSLYNEVGPLDEDFGVGMFEDDDYACRVRQSGYRLICAADAFVHHVGQATFKKLIETGEYNELWERNQRHFETKWRTRWIKQASQALDFRADYLGVR